MPPAHRGQDSRLVAAEAHEMRASRFARDESMRTRQHGRKMAGHAARCQATFFGADIVAPPPDGRASRQLGRERCFLLCLSTR